METKTEIDGMNTTDAVIFLDTVMRGEDFSTEYKAEVQELVKEKIEKDLSWQ